MILFFNASNLFFKVYTNAHLLLSSGGEEAPTEHLVALMVFPKK
jgi:hypothetical protein